MKGKKHHTARTAREDKFIACKHALEKKLYELIRQDTVQQPKNLYVIEVKTEPNAWQRIDRAYPEIPYLRAIYHREDLANDAKSIVKWFFNSIYAPKSKKRPIRIRKIENARRI